MDKHDRKIMIKELMKVKLQKKLLDTLRDSEIVRLFGILRRHIP
jgi:hypothetical protein|tara:strand:- start:212 stop:343 length:132 start_codon:yes stop_codon:yes gene_type:complete